MRKCATTWKICLRKDDGTWTEYRHPESRIPADRNPWNFQEETAAPMGMETFLKLIYPAATTPHMISLRNFLKTACSPDESGLHFSAHFYPLPSRAGADACNHHSTKQHNARRTADTARSGHCAGMCSVSGTVLTDCPHCINGGGGI